MRTIYFDNSATTRVDDEVAAKMTDIMQNNYGNPSSLHFMGAQAYNELEKARHQIAKVISAKTSKIYFTSGGTEANNIAIKGISRKRKPMGGKIVTTALEHASVLTACKALAQEGFETVFVDSDPSSHQFSAKRLLDRVENDTVLVSFMHVNNETGEILPVKELIQGIRERAPMAWIHCDCVQSFGKYPFKLFDYDVDAVSMSAHKLHGPKGVGALYLRDGSKVDPLLHGGMQERGMKPGTENVQSICGFGVAADRSLCKMGANLAHMERLKARLTERIVRCKNIHFNSPETSVPYIFNFSVLGKASDETVKFMGIHGIQVSAGSACSKGAKSHVLQAMSYPANIVESALRVGFSKDNTMDEVDYFVHVLEEWEKISDSGAGWI